MDDQAPEQDSSDSDRAAAEDLSISAEMYAQLKRLANFHLRTYRQDMTLNCTALVHEAYLKMAASSSETDGSHEHYAAVASLAMRQILVDYARRKKAKKYGGDAIQVTLQESSASTDATSIDLLALDDALSKLAETDPLLEKVVAMRFFGGFSIAETARALDRSTRSIERDWTRARIYLYRDLGLAGGELT
jgi:RNA polymerase sigma factor (TIGR02999 family)